MKFTSNISGYAFSLTILAGALVPHTAYAEKWVGIADGWYVDADHKDRKGDLSKAFIRTPEGRHAFITFDCKDRKVIDPASWNDGPFSDESPLGKMFSTACKSWYEVWK